MNEKVDSQLIVIFGASGDLTGRKLIPSLYELHKRDLLPEKLCVMGAAVPSIPTRNSVTYSVKTWSIRKKGKSLNPAISTLFWSISAM